MKNIIQKYPNTYTYFLAILLFACALFISVLINKGFIKEYFPFTAVILLAFATWYLYRREHKSLNEIGFNLKLKNVRFLPLGILIGAGVYLLAKYLRTIYLGEDFNISKAINYQDVLIAFYTILPTVAVEEFLFRGYLFKKTIELSSVIKANIIFSILFMLIHVLDSNVLQNPGMIIILTISIPVGHLMYATALLKSKSLFFPIGIHLGNNWATRHLVSVTNDGGSIFYISNKVYFDTWPSFITFILLWNSIFLIATFIIWKWDKISSFNFFKKNLP